ncbi:hypothetical protein HS088_TW04G01544 [Tripterygium wilfordii]|uniref:Uncharacterized protein n=1 Tax=Tripterygium wilfordii TaxID=458696 RepID=A0A7J7DTU4_TRIWF|nr:uncharacterized protein LOC119997929 [Tripterygium wilfordii]KAF5749574.1 hypothetical protein HS088_TW04G01544 [Tripterygium wilfordii]
MRISLVFFLLLWSHILHGAQGIRLDKGFLPIRNKQIQEEKKSTSIKSSTVNVGALAEDLVLCKGGHCTGKSSKLSTTTTVSTTNTFSKDGGNEANSLKSIVKGKSGNHEEVDENLKAKSPDHQRHYVDIADINEMDYSPVTRKPPIHN